MMNKKLVKKVLAGVLSLALVVAGFICVPDEAQAEGNTALKWQEVENAIFVKKINAHEAPAYVKDANDTSNVGYLFAGWYDKENGNPITSADGVTGTVCAKFIPASLTGIACQVDMNTDKSKRNMRVVSLIDSDQYSEVGFNIYGRYDKDEIESNGNEYEWEMYKYNPDAQNDMQEIDIYTGLYQYVDKNGDGKVDKEEREMKEPQHVFGTAAADFYFTTVSIANIPSDFYDATMVVQPYWVTLDGTYVEGMGEFNRISDYGTDTVVRNISVNIKDATEIAAGLLDITIPQEFAGYDIKVESGRVFDEFAYKINESTVRCIGNVKNIKEHASEPNSVFVNIRITTPKTDIIPLGQNTFNVTLPSIGGFSTNKEVEAEVSVWDVIY